MVAVVIVLRLYRHGETSRKDGGETGSHRTPDVVKIAP